MVKEPLNCSLEQARVGCKEIVKHVRAMITSSKAILTATGTKPEKKSMLRSSFILNLIAYEETGKLFMMWQAAADAERRQCQTIEIESFEYHDPKGDVAGDLCCQMIDYFESKVMPALQSAMVESRSGPPTIIDFAGEMLLEDFRNTLSAHKERVHRIRKYFSREREDAMYVDFRDGVWTRCDQMSDSMLRMDCMLLSTIAEVAEAFLDEGLPFSHATKALIDIRSETMSQEVDEFMKVVRKTVPEVSGQK